MRLISNRTLGLAALALLPAGPVLAGGSALIESRSEGMNSVTSATSQTIDWYDLKTVRLEFAEAGGYLLVRDGKAYSVTEESGTAQVIELGAMMQKMRSGGDSAKSGAFGHVEHIEPTDILDEVAGISGMVYRVTTANGSGETSTQDWVLTNDPLVVEMTAAYLETASAMYGNPEGDDHISQFEDMLPSEHRGILRAGENYRVISISDEDVPKARFELPAKPMDLSDFMNN